MELTGIGVSQGIAVGSALLYRPFAPCTEPKTIAEDQVGEALLCYKQAVEAAKVELVLICEGLQGQGAPEAKIFNAHLDILQDPAIDEEIRQAVQLDLWDIPWAVYSVYHQYAAVLEAHSNTLIRERAADMRDVCNRVLRCLAGEAEQNLSRLATPVVVVAQDLLPSDTATMDRGNVLAIVTETGGPTSHSAIIARSYGIPALLGVDGITEKLHNGEQVIVDALGGKLITQPDSAALAHYEKLREANLARAADVQRFRAIKPVTRDGVTVQIALNVGSENKQELQAAHWVDGVGLYRTEFLYMNRARLPDEEEQYAAYKSILEAFAPRHVTLRTLDIGADKQSDCLVLPQEPNPFLGNRALRFCFDNEEIFLTQLRAALRASVHGSLWIMFPMVGSLDDIHRAKELLERAKRQLRKAGRPFASDCKVGVMIEIPALALVADLVAQEVDFASIGTNDLTQYALAVDRVEPSVHQYYQELHPGVMRLIRQIAAAFQAAEKPLCVCGELAGNPLAAVVLVGMGLRQLSMGAAAVPEVKKVISGIALEQAEALAQTACSLPTAKQVEELLRDALTR